MNERERDVKINWFCLRTGADREVALTYLKLSQFKIEEAIRMRRQDNETKHREALAKNIFPKEIE